MNMIFGVKDRPKFGQTILFAIQQLLAIMAATLVVPVITNGATGSTLSPAAALFGAGVGTLVYLLFTKFRSPVFLGSSFAFLGSMAAAFCSADLSKMSGSFLIAYRVTFFAFAPRQASIVSFHASCCGTMITKPFLHHPGLGMINSQSAFPA